MYEQFFEMTHTPFTRDVPPEALYESPAMRDALGRLAYVADRQLFAVVTADAGCGKSTLIRKFAASLPKEKYILLYLSDSKLTPRWFYRGCLDQLGLEARFYRGDAKRQLQKEIELVRAFPGSMGVVRGDDVLVVVDAAEADEGARHEGAGGAGGDEARDVVLVPQEHDGLHHRAVALEPHHVGGLFVAADDFRRMDDFQPGGVESLAFQLFPEGRLISREDEAEVGVFRKAGEGARHGRFRRMVAAEAVDEDPDHTSFFT